MKRLAALAIILFAVLFALPAGANEIPDATVTVTCTAVTFDWTQFPDHEVILYVLIENGDLTTDGTVNTFGESYGSGSVPLVLTGAGSVTVSLSWTLGDVPRKVTVSREFDCTATPPTTTPPTTAPPTTTPGTVEPPTTVGETPTTVVDVGVPASFAPAELANTGVSHVWLDLLGAALMVAFGAVLVIGSRTRRGNA